MEPPAPRRRHRAPPWVTEQLARSPGPVVAVSDWMRAVPDQIARWVPRRCASLGTDGFGRSDTREALRRFFETDAPHVVLAVLSELVADGALVPAALHDAIERYGIETDLPAPGCAERREHRHVLLCQSVPFFGTVSAGASRWRPADRTPAVRPDATPNYRLRPCPAR